MSEKEENRSLPEIIIRELGTETEILINGTRVEGCINKYSVEHGSGKTAKPTLDIPAAHMTLEGRMIPALPEVFRPFYEAKRDQEKDVKELDEQDLHCISRILQSVIFMNELFYGCNYCKFREDCYENNKPKSKMHIDELRKRLQDYTEVDLRYGYSSLEAKFQGHQ